MTKDRINEIRADGTEKIASYVYSNQKELDLLKSKLDDALALDAEKVSSKNLDAKVNIKEKIGHLKQLIHEMEIDAEKEFQENKIKVLEETAIQARKEAYPVMKAYNEALKNAFLIASEFKGENVFKFHFSDVLGLDGNRLFGELSRLMTLSDKEMMHYNSFMEMQKAK